MSAGWLRRAAVTLLHEMIVREQFDNGLRLLTESMPDVRSVSFAAWLTRGSRHESATRSGISHFVEHMIFKGTPARSAEDIAQEIDSIGGQLDAFTAKECASYYVKVLDEHLPRAVAVLSDLLLHPKFDAGDIEREKKVVLEEIKMVEDTPDDLVHELFTQRFWSGHPLGRPILGVPDTVDDLDSATLHDYFGGAYTARNLVIAAAGNVDHAAVRDLVTDAFGAVPLDGEQIEVSAPTAVPGLVLHSKPLEQSHIVLGASGYPQQHDDRYVCYVLNVVLGGSMSSRLFQNIREKRGLAYAVSSGLVSYCDGGAATVYAGCDTAAVREVIDLVVAELQDLRDRPISADELQRTKDHLKGSLVLNLESTSSRMSHMARQEIYFGRQFTLDDTLQGVEKVTSDDVLRVARDLFPPGALAATVLGPVDKLGLSDDQLGLV
ncbi:MAG: pitrilysin family protein [Vicinamibacterales bacterium]|nr:pitrilysin family protein [Vicinamibacterales bacterium]